MSKRLNFTYRWCNNIEAMRVFYKDILGLDLIWDTPEFIAFKVGDHQLSFQLDETLSASEPVFADQPGWKGGTTHRTSWSLECDRVAFDEIVNRSLIAGVPSYRSEPQWVGYASFVLLDPMNETLEITCTEPESSSQA